MKAKAVRTKEQGSTGLKLTLTIDGRRFPTERALTAQLERLTSDKVIFLETDEDEHTAIAQTSSGQVFCYDDTKRGWFSVSWEE
jgi:hypothetical protein